MQVHRVQLADVDRAVKFLEVLPTDEETTIVGVAVDLVFFLQLWGPLGGVLGPRSFPYHIPPRVPKLQHSFILYLVNAQQRIGVIAY